MLVSFTANFKRAESVVRVKEVASEPRDVRLSAKFVNLSLNGFE